MYEERRESFSVRDLILQVLFIVLFVFILIWLFPTKDYMKKYIKDNKGSNTTIVQSDFDVDQLAVLYNQIFANNVVAMKEAAVGYYTTDRLPAKVGESDKMTLQQMYDKHLVLKLTDKNGNACDVNKSYVSVTKYENEYQMKVNLSCGSEEDYIIVYLGCYDYCDAAGVCEKKTPTKPVTPSKPSKPNNTTVNKVTNITNNYYYNNCDCEKPKYYCSIVNGKYYDASGNEVDKEAYEKACTTPNKYYCSVVNGKYYDDKGNLTDKAGYEKACSVKYYCKVVDGKYYDDKGNLTDKAGYEKACSTKKYICEYKKVTNGSWGPYGEWSSWTITKISSSDNTQVETKSEKVVTGYTTDRKQTGTKNETYISGYTTSRYISGYTTEKYQSGTTTEKYISGYTTQKVQTGTKKVQVGTTKQTTTKKVAAGTTSTRVSSGSGRTIPSNTSEYKYVKTGSTTSQSCSSCATVTIYTWDVYKIQTVYRTETVTVDVPVYSTEPVYETKQVPVYATKQVPVYSTRQVPVYSTKKTPVYATKQVPVYEEVKVPVYGTQVYYRSRTRVYNGGTTDIKWSTCDPVDTSLTNQGYYQTGNVKEA